MKPKITEDEMDRDLETLNTLLAKYRKAHAKLCAAYSKEQAEMDERLLSLRKCANLASAKFELFRKKMPKTKFDMSTGKYYYSEMDGKEIFKIKVVRSTSTVMSMVASTEEEAIEATRKLVQMAPPEFLNTVPEWSYENVSR